eukprot:3670689-Pyramimonas_sp.AAC.1
MQTAVREGGGVTQVEPSQTCQPREGLRVGRLFTTCTPQQRIFPHRTNQMQEAWVYSHAGPIRCRKRGYIPTMDQADGKHDGAREHHERALAVSRLDMTI